jgi:hypothetical protein
MKDKRPGEHLWLEWTGDGYTSTSSIVFFTAEHVDIENEVVKRALASSIQRSGVIDSLGQGFAAIDKASTSHGLAGIVAGELDFSVCDELGETHYGDLVEEIFEVTWVSL